MQEIKSSYLKQLGAICAAHLNNELPDGADKIFDTLLKGEQAILKPLLSSLDERLQPLRDLYNAYYSPDYIFPKLILVRYQPYCGIGHVFSIKIEQVDTNTYNIVILESLSKRRIDSYPRSLSQKFEAYQIKANENAKKTMNSFYETPYVERLDAVLNTLILLPSYTSCSLRNY